MQRLQDLILRLELATPSEINQAIFSTPDSGLVEALGSSLGAEREQRVLQGLASSLELPLLSDSEVKADSSITKVVGEELLSLAQRYKMLPVKLLGEGMRVRALLAVANPCDREGIQAFTSLLKAPVKLCLAREAAIVKASLCLSESRSDLSDSGEAVKAARGIRKKNPEAEKAVQQVIATAVKHNAEVAEISLSGAVTRVLFSIGEGQPHAVDISVDPQDIAGVLLERVHITERSDKAVSAIFRAEFKATSIDCKVSFYDYRVKDSELQRGKSEKHPSSAGKLVLSDFMIDVPENPCFWLGMPSSTAIRLRQLGDKSKGLLMIAGSEPLWIRRALKSLAETYPDSMIVEHFTLSDDVSRVFKTAEDHRVIAGLKERDVFAALEVLDQLDLSYRTVINGIACFARLLRSCCSCSQPYDPPLEVLSKIRGYSWDGEELFCQSKGCALCSGDGYLGSLSLCSVLQFSGRAGDLFRAGADCAQIAATLAEDDFLSLFESGLQCALEGETPLEIVLDELHAPPPEYETVRCSANSLGQDDNLFGQELEDDSPFNTLFFQAIDFERDDVLEEAKPKERPKKAERPLTGREAFMLQRGDSQSQNRQQSKEAELSKASKERTQVDPGSKLLLVIDDDSDQRAILRRVFEMAGYRVEVAADGIDGIVSASRLQPNLIVIDFMMPDLDGAETIKRLRGNSDTVEIPIIAITAYADAAVEYKLLQAGADDFCSKSVPKKVLLKRIERLLG